MKIQALSRHAAVALEPVGEKTVMISITDPGSLPAKFSVPYVLLLRLAFDDVETEEDVLTRTTMKLMTRQQAAAAAFAVHTAIVLRADIVVHCEAGVSRSVGMASTIADALPVFRMDWTPDQRDWNSPNAWVMNLMKEVLK